ncbi:hypothetical protein V6N12_058502 [Hibiscus sabdariffa]|uniref:RNase H type-1 domain-containing protein n=1 Tax=Hibiscus sabdariffa TaxID=183260 RepID=A0ABR2ESF5_9ROSI
MKNNGSCPMCGFPNKDVNHVMCSCPTVQLIWRRFVRVDHWVDFMSLSIKEWECVTSNVNNKTCSMRARPAVRELVGWKRPPDGWSELWGISEGLLAAWSIEIRRLIIEVDSVEAIKLIRHYVNASATLSLVPYIMAMMNRPWAIELEHSVISQLGEDCYELPFAGTGYLAMTLDV